MKIKFYFGLVIRNDKLNRKGTEVNELLMGKSGNKQLYLSMIRILI